MQARKIFLVALILIFVIWTHVLADFPHILNYQGRILDSAGNPLNDTVRLDFGIFEDSLASVQIFKETHTSVVITDGLFNVLLGSKKPLTNSVFDGPVRWLGIEVDFGDMLTPLTPIVSSAYSYYSGYADTAVYALTAPGGVDGWTQSGNYVRLADNTDSVGIGVSSPLEKLHVGGNLIIGGYGDIRFSPDNTRIDCESNDLKLHAEADLYLEPYNDIYIRKNGGANFTRIDLDNSKIGIGTHSPDERLHIENSQTGGSAFLQIETSHPTNWHEAGIRIKTPQNKWHLRMDDDLNNDLVEGALGLRSQNSGEEVMIWEEDGNVRVKDTLFAGALPEDFVSAENISDEPGLASAEGGAVFILNASWQTVASRSIDVPGEGYVIAIASFEFDYYHGYTGKTGFLYGISSISDSLEASETFEYEMHEDLDQGVYGEATACHRAFYIPTAGTYNYYFLAYLDEEPDHNVYIRHKVFTVLYIPTAYGGAPSKDFADGVDPAEYLGLDQDYKEELELLKNSEKPPVTVSELKGRINSLETELAVIKQKLEQLK